jgi:ubiquinone/menaquinone biosynthesis C-methylase UbiE
VILDIPDLRLSPDPYIGFAEEHAKVEKLAARFAELDFESFIDFYYSITSVVPPKHAAQYKRSLLAGVPRAAHWLTEWEQLAHAPAGGTLLEIGCGTGPLLAAARAYPQRVGVDVALRWLVVAKKRLEREQLDLPLLCAGAEALPFREETFDRIVFDSALEHFRVQLPALREAARVARSGGAFFIATPNRFSIGPDPHTGVPGGSLLPAAVTAALVRRAGGIPPKRDLLGAGSLRRLLQDAGLREVRLSLPGIASGQRAQFSGLLRAAMGAYELARRFPVSRQLLFAVGPLLLATARKQS